MAQVGHEDDGTSAGLDAIPDIVRAVVWNLESFYAELFDVYRHFLFKYPCRGVQALLDAITPSDALMGQGCGIDGDMEPFAQAYHPLDVVGMIVCDEDGSYVLHVYSCISQVFSDGACGYAGVHQYAVLFSTQIVTIAAATAGKTHES